MTSQSTAIGAAIVLSALASSAAFAQAGSGLRMPYESGVWGHAGASIGGSRLDATCPPGSGCDDSEQAVRVFGGGRFNNTFGGEIAWTRMGDFNRGGGETDAEAFDFALIAGVPFGNNWSAFAKAGLLYGRTEVSGTVPGLQTGKADGWGPRFGLGLQMGITQNWAARVDWDRYRFKMPSGHENIDTLMLGAQYTFR